MTGIGATALCRDSLTGYRPFEKSEIEQSIAARFAQQVRLHPRRLAVQAGNEVLTYEELNARANRIAFDLLDAIGEGEQPVALFLEQGVDCIAAMLGALKAGKIYVPLPPNSSADRIAHVLEDSQSRLILTKASNAAVANAWVTPARRILELDRGGGDSRGDPNLNLSADRLAYVYYTSGSTGTPKGVFDSHRNVLHNVMRYTNSLRIGAGDRLTLLQSPDFSGCVSSVFGALLNGAAVFPFDLRRDGFQAAARWLAHEQLTIYHSVPALFRGVMECAGNLPHLRLVRLEGDRCTARHVELFQKRFSESCQLVNGLGATETGISRQYFIDPATRLPGPTVPVGYATADVSVELRDEDGREVETGQIGEIVVSSPYLARGYWRSPDLTKSRFEGSNGRLRTFRSGDLGRLQPDGCLEHLGRCDSQVKIRGVFIDGLAVESALQSVVGIREARVLSREDSSGNSRLIAYFVASTPAKPSVTTIRRELATQLPEVAIPSSYVALPELPLDEYGKVNLGRLLPSDEGRPDVETAYVAPRTPLECLLASLWSEVLEVPQVGVEDNFFELGGDSLLAGRILARLANTFPCEVPLRLLFDEPTIARFARAVLGRADSVAQ